MKFTADRLSVLSGLMDSHSGQLINESTKKNRLNENALRKMIREEIQAYMSSKRTQDERLFRHGLQNLNLTSAMGYLNVTPPYATKQPNRAHSRGPGRTLGFGGPGFM
jgi:hypothetical protein|tara:strand:- start:34 stop:357 length:324 start_codon:yes stop_codon:yes gene_type:complete